MHAKGGGAGVGLAAHMRAESEGCVELKCLAGNPIELQPVPCALSYDACPLSEPTGSTVPSRSHCLSVRYLAGHSTLSTTTADATSCGKLWHWALGRPSWWSYQKPLCTPQAAKNGIAAHPLSLFCHCSASGHFAPLWRGRCCCCCCLSYSLDMIKL